MDSILQKKNKVDTQRKPKVFCYFPTSESLDFCFIMHAPFALVDNRQQIKREEEINTILFENLSKLASQSLAIMCQLAEERNKQWVDENLFDIVPLEGKYGDDDETKEQWFNKFYSAFREVLSRRDVHLNTKQKYVSAGMAKKVDDPIRQLLSIEQFNQLLSTRPNSQISYVHPKLRINDEIENYLDEIGINTFDVDDFGLEFSEVFIRKQDDKWLKQFYKFLLTDSARRLIEKYKLNYYASTTAPLLTKPFIRTARKTFVAPYTANGNVNIFVSSGNLHMEGMNYVDPVLCADTDFQSLLKKLNISIPDRRHYVENVILQRYTGNSSYYDNSRYQKDFRFIWKTYKTCPGQDIDDYIKMVQEKFKFRCLNKKFYRIEDVIYESSVQTLSVNRIVDVLHILDREFYRNIDGVYDCDSFLDRFDFSSFLKIKEVEVPDTKDLSIRIQGINKYELGNPHFTDYCIDTFDECCKKDKVSEDYSLFVWDSLFHYIKETNKWWLHGECTYQPYNDGRYKKRSCQFESTLSFSIRRNKWLYNKEGQLCSPNNVYVEDLSSKYTIAESMISIIGLKHLPQTEDMKIIAEQCSKSTLEAAEMGQKFRDAGVKKENVDEIIQSWKNGMQKREKEAERVVEKKRQEEELRKKMQLMQGENGEPIFTHRQNRYSVDETFDHKVPFMSAMPKQQETQTPIDIDSKIEQLKEEKAENERLRQIASDERKRYTYEWFMALLEMEFNASGEENRNKRGIEINFSRTEKDPYSEHGVILKNPSRRVPMAIEEMNNIAVTFRLPEDTHTTIVFEVASVQDYTLRLKGKNEDIEKIDNLLSIAHKIYRAELKTGTPVQLIAKLQDAFFDLQLGNDFNMMENINPNIKFIFGPPGTGKTTHLVYNWIRKVAVRHKKKMLVLCPTNKAADVIAQRAFALLDPKSYPEDWLYRFVATNEDSLQNHICMRDDDVWNANKCCIISTIARFAYDGFDGAKF